MSRANTMWGGWNNNAEVRCETSIHIIVIIVLWAGQVDLLLLPLPTEPFSLHCLLPEMKYLHYQTPGVLLNPLPGACISDDKASRPSLSAWCFKDIWSLTMSHVFQYHVKREAGLHSLKRKKKNLFCTHIQHMQHSCDDFYLVEQMDSAHMVETSQPHFSNSHWSLVCTIVSLIWCVVWALCGSLKHPNFPQLLQTENHRWKNFSSGAPSIKL